MKVVVLAVFLGLVAGTDNAAAQETKHLIGEGATNYGALAFSEFNRRLEADASNYIQKYPGGAISRFVKFDSAFPIDETEYRASGGYGVLFVSAFSRDQAELPLASVYVGGVKLKFIGGISREVLPDSSAYTAFGSYRVDSFWLVPANLFRPDAAITADFAKNRQGFSVGHGLPPPDFMKAHPDPVPNGKPDAAVLKKLVSRKYPGFGIEVSP